VPLEQALQVRELQVRVVHKLLVLRELQVRVAHMLRVLLVQRELGVPLVQQVQRGSFGNRPIRSSRA